MGQQAAEELLEGLASGGCTDQWLQDQLVIFMALAQVSNSTRDALPCLPAALQLTIPAFTVVPYALTTLHMACHWHRARVPCR